nr:collagen alpha-1(I) chain [Oryctolagus cuniculus]
MTQARRPPASRARDRLRPPGHRGRGTRHQAKYRAGGGRAGRAGRGNCRFPRPRGACGRPESGGPGSGEPGASRRPGGPGSPVISAATAPAGERALAAPGPLAGSPCAGGASSEGGARRCGGCGPRRAARAPAAAPPARAGSARLSAGILGQDRPQGSSGPIREMGRQQRRGKCAVPACLAQSRARSSGSCGKKAPDKGCNVCSVQGPSEALRRRGGKAGPKRTFRCGRTATSLQMALCTVTG